MTAIGLFSFVDIIPLISFDQIVFTSLLLCFGAGVLLCTALLHIMPEVFVVTIVFAFVFVLVFILILVFVFVLPFHCLCHLLMMPYQVREGLEAHSKSLGVGFLITFFTNAFIMRWQKCFYEALF